MTQRRFILLDRDGTINVERHYLSDPDQVELIPGVADGLRHLSEMGFGLLVVTNQSAIGRGYFDQSRLDLIHNRLIELLSREGVKLDGIYFCPHTPEDACQCRKPRTALVEAAARDLNFNPEDSFVIGDKPCDIELGQKVGATTILVRTGYGAQFPSNATLLPDFVVEDMAQAADVIENLLASGSSTNMRN
jgi:D-glycero-D-manno-heptose 1,7-bisphosphate phosphatase